MSKNVIIGLSVALVVSVSINIYVLFIRAVPEKLAERIKELEEKEIVTKELLSDKQFEIDSLLSIPLPNPTIIKERIYENISIEYPDGTLIDNSDTLVYLWEKLARE